MTFHEFQHVLPSCALCLFRGGDAPSIRTIHVRAGFEQVRDHRDVGAHSGDVEGGAAVGVGKVDIGGKAAHELAGGVDVSLAGDVDEVAAEGVERVDVGGLDGAGEGGVEVAEEAKHVEAAVADGLAHARDAEAVARGPVGASAQQLARDGHEPVHARDVQGGAPVVVGKVGQRAARLRARLGAQQRADGGHVPRRHRGHQREGRLARRLRRRRARSRLRGLLGWERHFAVERSTAMEAAAVSGVGAVLRGGGREERNSSV